MIHLGLIGYPLDHSLSPKLHSAALQASRLEGDYSLFPIPPGDRKGLHDLLASLRCGDLDGLNVTIPFKRTIIQYLDDLTPEARVIGAVNTLLVKNGRLFGANTDAAGFRKDLRQLTNGKLEPGKRNGKRTEKKALVLGAGGAARAVVYSLKAMGWRVTMALRGQGQARDLADRYSVQVVGYQPGIFEALLPDLDLVVNTTPVGMFPRTGESPWPAGVSFPESAMVYDLVYNPLVTRFVEGARAAGLPAMTGMGMLVEQARLAFKLWTGRDVPASVMAGGIYESVQ